MTDGSRARDSDMGPLAAEIEALRRCLGPLEAAAADRNILRGLAPAERGRLLQAISRIHSPDVRALKKQFKAEQRERRAARQQRDRELMAGAGIRELRSRPVFTTPNLDPPEGDGPREAPDSVRELLEPMVCYVCKQPYRQLHDFYDQLCPPCAEFNFAKRQQTADLSGRVAILTGGRIKIGYQAGIKLLRAGATVIVTTRFPRDAALRYSREPDFAAWGDRLQVFGLDLRHTPSVEGFCRYVAQSLPRLDFIISNACQTVRRPAQFYRHMLAAETAAAAALPAGAQAVLGDYEGLRGAELVPGDGRPGFLAGLTHAAELSQAELTAEDREGASELFPEGQLDQDLQQVDLRARNSWRLLLADVSAVELLETQLVNAVAPFVLNGRLRGLMASSPERDKHIVNVSAVEGQFYRRFKTTRHPHTNMAKAALNMMTRTSAAEYHADGIHMNSVDTGWVTDEDPAPLAAAKTAEHGFHPPLDIVDGAARILDPILDGFNTGHHVWGRFLKDYRPTDW